MRWSRRFGRIGLTVVITTWILLGMVSGAARTFYPATLAQRAEVVRMRAWQALDLDQPSPAARSRSVERLEGRFAAKPAWIALHASVGAAFLLLASLQFLPRIRTRHIQFHRWNGRVLLTAGILITGTGMYFGIVVPAAGMREAMIIGFVSAFFLVSLTNGLLAIRRKNPRRHREWMIRAFAAAVGITSVRIVALIGDAVLTPRGWLLEDVFVLSLALGWAITLIAAELWILFTRESVDLAVPANAGAA